MREMIENGVIGKPESETASLALSPQKKRGGFQPGVSGNPAGRPKGSVSPATRLRNQITDKGEKILDELMRQIENREAKPRDLIAALQFIVGPLRGELGGTVIPGMAEATTYQEKLDALLDAQTNGAVSPDTAKIIMDTLVKAEEAEQMRMMNDEIRKLQARLVNGSAVRIGS